ncbi:hypothetical protein BGZ83_009265 [Gryganskiella cystojenkinii]|nr:hypothetical protein BGZ83_009265 [Gryganskiella cystojenkinii]
MRKLVAEDRIQVEYSWRHNHDTSSEAMAKLPNGYNELQWTKAKVAEGLDWKDIKGQCRSSSSSPPPLQDTVQEADRQSDREGGSLATRITYDHYRRVIYRQQTGESRKSNDISTSVKRWMEQITKEGGKSMFEDHINDNPDNFIIAWSTPFQLKIMGENSTSAFIDTNDTAVKSIKRNVANSRVTTSAYLVTLLVTDKTIQGSVPIAYMICGSESSVVLEKWLTWLKTDCGFSASTLMVDCSLADVEIIKRGVSFISIYYDPFHVRKAWERKMVQFHSISEWDTMRPQLQQIRSASSAEKLVAAWNAFLTKFPGATEMIQYLGQWLNPNLAAKWVLYMREYQSPQHVEALEVAETWQGILKKHSLGKRRDMRADSVIFLLHGQIDAEFEELYSMAQAG